jgi:DNA modification methylase
MTAIKKEVVIGDCRLLLGDCLEIMPTLERVDAILTDPPYGIGIDGQKRRIKGKKSDRKGYEFKGWDAQRPESALRLIGAMACPKIIWGGNYFADLFPAGEKWLSWDKGQRLSQSDCELAYTSLTGALRVFTLNRVALMQDGAEHPTQKPVALMEWCLGFLPNAETVLDCYMGSGTTGVACVNLGRKFIGIELDPGYFDIAVKRIEEAYKQPRLFDEPPPKPVQEKML